MKVRIALTTVSKRSDAERLAEILLDKRAAACVTLVPGAHSFYMWKGKRRRETEILLFIKTTRAALPRLARLLREHHPYEVHELLAWTPAASNPPYARWLEEACRVPPPRRPTTRKRKGKNS
jgi:periplasmic divalent cation tolerance protein